MGTRKYNPVTPGTRFAKVSDFDDVTRKKPEKSLTATLKKSGGRNNLGRKTVNGRGGGHKRKYRIIDFKYTKKGQTGIIESVEYDPNRSARIALIKYEDGQKLYTIAAFGMKVGSRIECGPSARRETGNSMPLKRVPVGSEVFCIEMNPGQGAKIARSAGISAVVQAIDSGDVHLKMPSGEIRLVREECYASLGKVGNPDHEKVVLGKAGKSRYLGRRPTSRGVAKNPVDHPMGGGEGKSSGGRHPCSPWGKISKGLKTRKKKKSSSSRILKRRK